MNVTTLQQFRQEIYSSFEQAGDALFTTVDALISESQAQSFPELSLSPFFVRSWSSLYKGFKRGRVNREELQNIFLKYLPMPAVGKRYGPAIIEFFFCGDKIIKYLCIGSYFSFFYPLAKLI